MGEKTEGGINAAGKEGKEYIDSDESEIQGVLYMDTESYRITRGRNGRDTTGVYRG